MSCPSGQHVVEKQVNSCCKTRVCECDLCVEPQPCQEGWTAIDSIADECGCSSRQCQPPTMCMLGGEQYQPGESWMDDVCTECTCQSDPSGVQQYAPKCTAIKCGTCSAGYTYVPVAGQCCGDCIPTVCHFDGKQYAPGQTWTSPGMHVLF